MAIPNNILRGEGNKAYPANANIVNGAGYLKDGDSLQTNVETFDSAGGGSLGIQGLTLTVDNSLPGYYATALGGDGGISLFNFMKHFCKLIQNGWDPTVTCWATEVSRNMARFNIQPKGSDGAAFPVRVNYELVRIRDWVYTED